MIKKIILLDTHYFNRNHHSAADPASGNSKTLYSKSQQGTYGPSDCS